MSGAPSNEWTGRQAFRAAERLPSLTETWPSLVRTLATDEVHEALVDDIVTRRTAHLERRPLIPRGPVPHHEPAPDAIDDGPQHKPGRLIASHPIVFPARLAPDMTPAKPRWSGTTPELHAAYFDEVKP